MFDHSDGLLRYDLAKIVSEINTLRESNQPISARKANNRWKEFKRLKKHVDAAHSKRARRPPPRSRRGCLQFISGSLKSRAEFWRCGNPSRACPANSCPACSGAGRRRRVQGNMGLTDEPTDKTILYQDCTEIMMSQSPSRQVEGFKALNRVLTAELN